MMTLHAFRSSQNRLASLSVYVVDGGGGGVLIIIVAIKAGECRSWTVAVLGAGVQAAAHARVMTHILKLSKVSIFMFYVLLS